MKKPKHIHAWWFDQEDKDDVARIVCTDCGEIFMESDSLDAMRQTCKERGIKVIGRIEYERKTGRRK